MYVWFLDGCCDRPSFQSIHAADPVSPRAGYGALVETWGFEESSILYPLMGPLLRFPRRPTSLMKSTIAKQILIEDVRIRTVEGPKILAG